MSLVNSVTKHIKSVFARVKIYSQFQRHFRCIHISKSIVWLFVCVGIGSSTVTANTKPVPDAKISNVTNVMGVDNTSVVTSPKLTIHNRNFVMWSWPRDDVDEPGALGRFSAKYTLT